MANLSVASPKSEIDSTLEQVPIGKFQIRIAILCGIVAMLDGFDTQAIAFIAPTLGEAWGLPPNLLGLIFAAGLVGIMVGQVTLGLLSDRFGRRPVIIFCTALFGVFSLLTVFAESWTTLLILRFLTGIGLGGATPNIIALVAEYSPPRARSTMVTTMFAGFPLGAALGGYVSSLLIPAFGWHSVFILGGILPLLLLVPLYLWLFESPHHLLHGKRDLKALNRVLDRIAGPDRTPIVPIDASTRGSADTGQKRPGYAALFSAGLGKVTLPLWAAYFNSLLMIYFLMSWLPMIARQSGLALNLSIISAVFLNLGGAIGGILLGRLADRMGAFRTLAVGYTIAAVALVSIGMVSGHTVLLMGLAFIAGAFTIGGQTAMNAATAGLYPASVRATALGAALAVGRVGSILGPTLGGLLLSASWPLSMVFIMVAVPAFLTAVLSIWISRASHVG